MRNFLVAVTLLSLLSTATDCYAQVQAQFTYEAVANCERPAMRNVPIRVTGTGRLSTDRSASLQTYSNVEGSKNYNVTLGGKPTEASNGSASLRVLGRSSLRAVREYPNNLVIIDLKIVGAQCQIQVKHQLKPGKRQYTFETSFGVAYCDRPTTTRTSCGGG